MNTPIAWIILIANVLLSLSVMNGKSDLHRKLMLHPFSFIREKRYWQVLTSGFIHADITHLLFNMMTFYFFAFPLEQVIGSLSFAILYFLGLVLSDISTIIKHKDNPGYFSLGASGAVSTVLFSYILFDPLTKLYIFFIPIGIPAYIFGGLYLIYCAYAAKQNRGNINHDAHFYGALTGLVITIIMYPNILGHFINTVLGS
ncbi:MAG: membrane associated rhomboid family serine protease [Sphingobacteriales bacterium]|jgi:membrane associated rhomboid family serine protease